MQRYCRRSSSALCVVLARAHNSSCVSVRSNVRSAALDTTPAEAAAGEVLRSAILLDRESCVFERQSVWTKFRSFFGLEGLVGSVNDCRALGGYIGHSAGLCVCELRRHCHDTESLKQECSVPDRVGPCRPVVVTCRTVLGRPGPQTPHFY